MNIKELKNAVILFAGDSGDGIQLTGAQFSQTVAFFGNDLNTLPDFPAEIRAPSGTIAGVSGFQIHFGSKEINSPGDACDVLVAMNAAALKKNINKVKEAGIIICNSAVEIKRNPIANKIFFIAYIFKVSEYTNFIYSKLDFYS